MTKVVFFNGPPRSGKDTAAQHCYSLFPYSYIERFSNPLRDAITILLQRDPSDVDEVIEEYKSGRINIREMLIIMSEQIVKLHLGETYLGEALVNRLIKSEYMGAPLVLIPDCGFYGETEVVVNHVGNHNCMLIRIHRDGCSFEYDSRSYIELEKIGVLTAEIQNDGIDRFLTSIAGTVRRFINGIN